RLAGVQTPQRLLALMRRHLPRPTEANAARLGALAALTGARADQLTLELGKAAEDSEHQPAVSGRGVGPAVLQRLEAGAALADLAEHVEQVTRGSRQPIEPRDDQHVAVLELPDRLRQLGPVGLGTRNLFLEYLGAASGHELGVLAREILAVGAYPCISEHRHLVTLSCIELLSIRYARLNRAKINVKFSMRNF